MSIYCGVFAQRLEGEELKQTNRTRGGSCQRVVVDCSSRLNKHLSGGRSLAGCLVIALVSFALHANSQLLDKVSTESSHEILHEGELQDQREREVVPNALIQQLTAKWRAEAMAGTNGAQMSKDHRELLVDSLSRVNWTPFCSYTETSILPDEEEPRIRHHTAEFNQDTLEQLVERAAESSTNFDGETDDSESNGFATALDEFAGMREDLTAANVISASELSVVYELPVPSKFLEEEGAASEDMGNMERRFMKKLMENLRVLFTVDAQNRGPKEVRIDLLKPVRVFPGVKMKKMSFATNFRYLDDIQEFAVDRNASEMSIRAFLVAGFSESESETLSDFRCIPKG